MLLFIVVRCEMLLQYFCDTINVKVSTDLHIKVLVKVPLCDSSPAA